MLLLSKRNLALTAAVAGILCGLLYLATVSPPAPKQPRATSAASLGQNEGGKQAQPMKPKSIAICLEEGISSETYEAAAKALQKAYEIEAVWGPPLVVPAQALDKHRGQYLADAVLSCVPLPAGTSLSLGIVRSDLYTPGLNFVFGMAQGRRALISIHRLQAGALGHALFMRRVAVEAVHEVGHLLGLGHCSNPACVMFFSNTLADTDRKGAEPCAVCKAALHDRSE